MKTKSRSAATSPAPRRAAAVSEYGPMMHDLHRRAETQLRTQRKNQKSQVNLPKSETDPLRLLHELQVHQVELELQNEELRRTRDEMEAARDKYTDLYDFAPVGYFTLAADGKILQLNLTGAQFAGMERSRLVGRPFGRLMSAEMRPVFNAFLKEVFAGSAKQSGDFELLIEGQPPRAVSIEAQSLLNGRECRAVVMDVTEGQRAAKVATKLAAIVLTTDDAIYSKTLAGVITSWNPGAERMFGYRAGEIVGKNVSVLIPPARAGESERLTAKSLRGEPVMNWETERVRKDGSLVCVSLSSALMRDGTGQCTGLSVIGRDVAERKQAEEKLRVSEIRYRRLFEAAHDGVLILDAATRKITDANPFMTKLLGYKHAQLVGKELFEIGLLKDEGASREMFRKLKVTHEVRYEDLPLESQHGRHQEVEVVANLYQENGHAVIQCNIRDITERKLVEQQLTEKARLLDLSHDAIIVRDAEGHIRYWNHGAEELYGWSRQEALGRISHRLFHTQYITPLKQLTEELHRTNRWTGELVHQTRDGRRITVLVRKTLDRDRHGHPASVLETITDMTQRKLAEATLRRVEVLAASNRKLEREIVRRQAVEVALKKSERHQRHLLEQSNQQQAQLQRLSRQILMAQEEERREISRELHDVIAQTLTGINVRLAALKRGAEIDIKSLDRNIARTQRLVEKSVDIVHQFARELRPAVLDDLGLIPALHSFLKSFMTRTGIRTRLKVFAEVEQLDGGKRTALYRVAQEALTNVARHAHASRVEINIQKLPDCVRMRIKDDGRSFEVERTLRPGASKRLGLLGMRERVEMVGGKFAVESAPGKGTTIEAQIPFGKNRTQGGGRPDGLDGFP